MAIEEREKSKKLELPPLVPMLETLMEYADKNEIPKLESGFEMTALIGGPNKQYYAACYEIVKVMILAKEEKRRCVVFHGIADTGKSWIAKKPLRQNHQQEVTRV